MSGDTFQFKKQISLATSDNHQLALFPEGNQPEFNIRSSALYQKLWSAQKRKFAAFSSNAKLRSQVALADLYRDDCRNHPVTENYPWEWPEYPLQTRQQQIHQQQTALQQLLEEISRLIGHALSRPCPVFEDQNAVRVELLDCFAWVAMKAERELCTEVKDSSGGWHLSVIGFDLMKPLNTHFWISLVLLSRVPQIVVSFGSGAGEAYEWLRKKLVKRFQNDKYLAGIRRQVAQHMSMVPDLTRAMLYIRQKNKARAEILSAEYSLAWAKEPFWSELFQRHPGMLLFYNHAVGNNLISEGDDIGKLRTRCLECGMRVSEWRFLAREGEASYSAAISTNLETGMALTNAFGLVEFQVRAGLSTPLPQPLAENYIVFAGMVVDVEGNRGLGIDPRIAKTAAEYWSQLQDPAQIKKFAKEDWLEMLAWLRDTRPAIDRNQWRAGWPAIWRRYQDWVRLNRDQHQWESSVKQMTVNGLLVNPLTNSYEVALEGIRMRHCVSSYAEECRNGSYRLFSVVNEKTRKNLATVGLRKEGNVWKFSQARGKLNRKVDKEVVGLGRVLAKLYCRKERGRGRLSMT